MKAANTSRKEGSCTGGANTAFLLQLGGQAKELGGQLPPSLYAKRGFVFYAKLSAKLQQACTNNPQKL